MKQKIIYFIIGATAGYVSSTLVNYLSTPPLRHFPERNIYHKNESKIPSTEKAAQIPIEETFSKDVSARKKLTQNEKYKNIESINHHQELNRLKEVIKELSNEKAILEKQYQLSNNRVNELTLAVQTLDESDITDAQMLALKPDGFEEFRRQFRGKQRDEIYQFHQEEADLDWGYNMQTQLSDFIQTHLNASFINLHGVTCKVKRCELLITQLENNAWESIIKDMATQKWWQFNSTHSSSRSKDGEQHSFYLYLIQY